MDGRGPQTHEWMFYEVMWRAKALGAPYPLPWWVQQYFRRWSDTYDGGLFDSKEAAFASNAQYRYWNMVGVKDHHKESLVGQAGEIEPVYDQYSFLFFLFDPRTKQIHFPQIPEPHEDAKTLEQRLENGYLPSVVTTYRSPMGIDLVEKVLASVVGRRERSVVLGRLTARLTAPEPREAWLCAAIVPAGPTGFQRHDKAGRYLSDRRISFVRYLEAEQRVEVNASWGPVFDVRPTHFGLYGNGGSADPSFYLYNNPFCDLTSRGAMNGASEATDRLAGLCTAAFAWPMLLSPERPEFTLDVRLPVDDYRGQDDLSEIRAERADDLEGTARAFWIEKLDGSGLQAILPEDVRELFDLFRTCRANLLILADEGQIHPGPTIYDSFWVRDSSVEGIACALSGDQNLTERQFGFHYPGIFNAGFERIGPASAHGFFGGEHEKNDFEWDSNGEALWALGRFDRIRGPAAQFGAKLFSPYVVEGARWLQNNRSEYGILPSGWSAEHLGEKDKPHYWDDFWGISGLWEAAKLAERLGAPEAAEIWGTYDSVRRATIDSIRWVLDEQRRRGFWETFIPTGPADVGRLDSTIIGTVAYFHPCRLYMGKKLGDDIDYAARMTLETLWGRFVAGGFRHDAAWHCYGPYLTLQLAHAFLLLGDVRRMELCLAWAVRNAAYARTSRTQENAADQWQVVCGAWNEQHCYPIASDFAEMPPTWWYMGDIPHGWACAEFMLLLRDMLFFEADEDGTPHVYLAPGIPTTWLGEGQSVGVESAPTSFGYPFGFKLTHRQADKVVDIEILSPLPGNVSYVYPCRFGEVCEVVADGRDVPASGADVWLPAGMQRATIRYR